VSVTVGLGRTGSTMTCKKILAESGSVGRRLIALALISGSHGLGVRSIQPFWQWRRS
jgi:hypothetical protein